MVTDSVVDYTGFDVAEVLSAGVVCAVLQAERSKTVARSRICLRNMVISFLCFGNYEPYDRYSLKKTRRAAVYS